jgi:hypothetical protein
MTCKTCGGSGRIGVYVPEVNENVPCPDCAATTVPKPITVHSCADCPFCDRLYGPLADKHYAMCNAMNTPAEAFCVGHNVENKTRPERCPLPVSVEVEK